MIPHREQNLAFLLDAIGVTTEPSSIEGKRDWFDCYGDLIGTFDVNDGWAEVHAWCERNADADCDELGYIPNREMQICTDFDMAAAGYFGSAKRGMVH